MKWLLLVTFSLLAVGVFSAAFNNEEDVPLEELMEDEKEGADETETEQGDARFVKEDEKVGGVVAHSKSSLTENDEYDENEENDEYYENDNTQNDEPEGNFAEMNEDEVPNDIKAASDEKEDMTNENPEQ